MKTFITLILILFASNLHASSGWGKVVRVMAHAKANTQGAILFITEGNSGKPACSTADFGKGWAFSLDTELGRAMYSILLTAQSQNRTVGVLGTSNCNVWPDRAQPYAIYIRDESSQSTNQTSVEKTGQELIK